MPIPPASNMVTPLEPPEIRNDAMGTNVQPTESTGNPHSQTDSNLTSKGRQGFYSCQANSLPEIYKGEYPSS